MPIKEQNIKFLSSQVMDDVPEGGGAATGNEIPDGVMNNVFEDISDLDRAMGRFNLRKLFLAVRTVSTDLFGGAKSVVTALPEDPAIGYTLFTTDDPFDTRDNAANRVEAYLFKGPMWHGALYENHIEGMRQIRLIQRPGTNLPPRGKTLCLVSNEEKSGEVEQYVRVTEVTAEIQLVYDPDKGEDFEALIVTADLSDALRHDFEGHTPNRSFSYSYSSGKARLRDTTVAQATRYYGGQYLQAAAKIGDYKVQAQSMFTQLVPAAQSEEPLANQMLNPELVQVIDAGTRDVEVAQQAHTLAREVTAENRRLNWIETLSPVPGPGALTLSYMAEGNWYTLQDDGQGVISGSDPGFGTGTIDYTNGNVTLTMGALPDVGSQLIYTYGSRVHYEVRSGVDATNTDKAVLSFNLEHSPVIPSSVSFSWTAGSEPKVAETDKSGNVTGDATGSVDRLSGEVVLNFTTLPDRGSYVSVDYQWYESDNPGDRVRETDRLPYTSTMLLAKEPTPGTIYMEITLTPPEGVIYTHTLSVRDEGGRLIAYPQTVFSYGGGGNTTPKYTYYALIEEEQEVGTVTNDTITLNLGGITVKTKETEWKHGLGFSRWVKTDNFVDLAIDPAEDIIVKYNVAGVSSTSKPATDSHPIDALSINLNPEFTDRIVPDSVRFRLGGKTYDDRSGGLATDIDSSTGSGIDAGSLNYYTGEAEVTFWEGGQSTGFEVTSLLTVYGEWTATEGFFRTPSAPLKPESLQVTGITEDGEQIIALADENGEFTHEWLQGQANYTFGTAAVTFGKWVDDSSLSEEEKLEDWYDPANVEGGMIYKPRPMQTPTLRYNAVAFTYIPLDAEIVGIDAVRLPADGRVPIYRPGDVVMIMHPQDTAPQTVTSGDTIATRPRIAWVRLIDANGDSITEGYSLDRATGTVTIDDASSMTMPVTVRHTLADLRLVTDVQITGDIEVSRPLSHDYPAGETIVASCLIHGDRRARVAQTWDEKSWNGSWADALQGDEAEATLNLIDHPITVTNEGCDTDRWLFRCTNASSNQWELLSENRGLVWQGTYSQGGEDVAPINPRTRGSEGQGGVPYMTIPAAANGGGWSTGNVVRINTVGAIADFWIARAIQQSEEPLDDGADGCEIYALGNIDRP